jgi:hypothetical protein
MNRSAKIKLAAALGLGLAAAGAGGAIAATQSGSPKQESQAILNDAAKRLGVTPKALSEAFKNALADRVDAAVAAGRLTKEEGDAIKARIRSGPFPPFLGPPGPPFGAPGLDFKFGPSGVHAAIEPLGPAASYIGVTQAELRSQLQAGQTLAQVARSHGKSVDGLVQALITDAAKKLDAAVSAGRLTKAKEQSILADIKEHVTDLVNGRMPDKLGIRSGAFKVFPAPPGLPLAPGPVGGPLAEAASYIGLNQAQLRSQLEAGKTLAQIARSHGKSVDGLVETLVAAAQKKLDAAVSPFSTSTSRAGPAREI